MGSSSDKNWGADLAAGAVVALVAMPLCLGIALASGAPLVAGLITGILGGLIVSWAGGTQLLVSGPAAGLAAIVVAAITEMGSFEAFLTALVIAGVLQLVFGLIKAGRLAVFVPSSVVTGMLAAIGVLLLLQQSVYALGTDADTVRATLHQSMEAFGADFEGSHGGFSLLLLPFAAVQHAAPGAALVAGLVLLQLVLWEKLVPKEWAQRIPGPLVGVVFGAGIAAALGGTAWALPAGAFVSLPDVAGNPLGVFAWPDFSVIGQLTTWRVAVTLAVVASIETLLSMEATDRLDPLKRTSNGDRELVGQGLGNLVAGLIGGLPMTGVIVRSTANISAGGRTWRSAFAHGVFLLAAVVALPFVLRLIPLASLAAVLLHIGFKLAHPRRFAEAVRIGWRYALPLFGTVVAVVATDLLIGVGVGLVLSAFTVRLSTLRGKVVVEHSDDAPNQVRVQLARAVSFLNKPRLRSALNSLPAGAQVTVDGSRTDNFDHDVVEFLHDYRRTAQERGIELVLIDVPEPTGASAH